jgi:phospholipase/carboxylesterase
VPKVKTENPPLVILLHGVGSNEKSMFSFADSLPDHFLVISAQASLQIGPDNYAWFYVDFSTGKPVINKEQAEKSRNIIIAFIRELKEQYNFDENNIYLCGFSQGGIMSYSVGLTEPKIIKGIAVLGGRLLQEVRPLIASKNQLEQLNIFVAHGTEDGTLGIHYAREAVDYLKQLGLHPIYNEYPAGHYITNEMLTDVTNWLYASSISRL